MTKHETTAESLRAENERLREQLADMASEDATYRIQRDALAEALRQCRGYFDDRADAEYFTDSPTPLPNEEMRLLVEIDDALATLESPTDALTRQGQEWGDYNGQRAEAKQPSQRCPPGKCKAEARPGAACIGHCEAVEQPSQAVDELDRSAKHVTGAYWAKPNPDDLVPEGAPHPIEDVALRLSQPSQQEALVNQIVDEYEWRGEDDEGREAGYTPSDNERVMLKDFAMFLLSEMPIRSLQRPRVPEGWPDDDAVKRAIGVWFDDPALNGFDESVSECKDWRRRMRNALVAAAPDQQEDQQ